MSPLQGARTPPHLPEEGRGPGEPINQGQAGEANHYPPDGFSEELRGLGEVGLFILRGRVLVQELDQFRYPVTGLELVVEPYNSKSQTDR